MKKCFDCKNCCANISDDNRIEYTCALELWDNFKKHGGHCPFFSLTEFDKLFIQLFGQETYDRCFSFMDKLQVVRDNWDKLK